MKTKIVQTLPSTLESKTLYAVQVVNGFDLYLTDDNGKIKKIQSKNLGSDDLKIPERTVRTLDVTNAQLKIKGLKSITSDNSFTKRLKMNDLGEIVSTTESDITVNVPDTIKVQSKDITYTNQLTSINKVKLFEGITNQVSVKKTKT